MQIKPTLLTKNVPLIQTKHANTHHDHFAMNADMTFQSSQ